MNADVVITQEEYELFRKLLSIVQHSDPEKFAGKYFICGEGGDKDEHGLPDAILVCPALGLNESVIYVKKEG